MPTVVNPCARPVPRVVAAPLLQQQEDVLQSAAMGPQSQRRLTLQERTHQLQSQSHRKKHKTSGQQTLFGERAFDPTKNCPKCRGGPQSHKGHDPRCWNNKRKSKSMAATEEQRLRQHFSAPLSESEKCSGRFLTKEAAASFFAPREAVVGESISVSVTTTTTATTTATMATTVCSSSDSVLTGDYFHDQVTNIVQDLNFVEATKSSRAPLPMLAFAKIVVEETLRKKVERNKHFNGITMTVPPSCQQSMQPECHSIVGQKLLHVDWCSMHGINVQCPHCRVGVLKNDRTNFSKNKLLFPIFVVDGPPLWCMVMSMTCPRCRHRSNSNSGETLSALPACARAAYPVETKCALNKNSHIGQSATAAFDLLMPTHGNGDLCSRLLYHATNRSCLQRVEDCCSFYTSNAQTDQRKEPTPVCIEHHGYYIKAYPPTGDGIRDTCDAACSTSQTPWKISDHDRHIREIQKVGCHSTFAQDHTHKVTDNCYQKKSMGAFALWDCANENGEIASAVLVPSTKTIHFSHAAMALTRRRTFQPVAMCSDTWPAKSHFWSLLFDGLQGRLGLFHCVQRLTKTLKKNHVDHYRAVNCLLNCTCHCNDEDHELLLTALKEGTLSTKCSDDEISELKATKVFKQRCDRHLRKEIRPPHIMCSMLDDWFDQFKCSSSDGSRPARGRKDPISGDTLFTSETRSTVDECKKKSTHLQDPLPLTEMYDVIQPSPNAPHQLKECLSCRGESCLESFHLMLAHFGNCGMRTSLADNLNLTGAARHNLAIRHKRRLIGVTLENTVERKKTPAAYKSVIPFFNHAELNYVNQIACHAGTSTEDLPFKHVEELPHDNGERFFSEHLASMRETKPRCDVDCRCLCNVCGVTNAQPQKSMEQRQEAQPPIMLTTHGTQQQAAVMASPMAAAPIKTVVRPPTTNVLATEPTINNAMQPQQMQRCMPQQQQHQHQHQQQACVAAHQWQQQQQQHFMHCPPMTQPFTPFSPWMMGAQTQVAPVARFCCGRCRSWHNTVGGRGRPPHDHHCQHPTGKAGKQIDNNPSWRAI